jgi:hypothetical protein
VVVASAGLDADGLAVPAHEPESRISANAARPFFRRGVFRPAMGMRIGLR